MESERSVALEPRRSILDLGPRARLAFALAYVGVMLSIVVSAQFRPDRVFGFQMFNESLTVNIHLFRRVRGERQLVPLEHGAFVEHIDGEDRVVRWHDRVKDPVLGKLDTPTHAKYGLDGQLYRLQLALDDFAAQLPPHGRTVGLVAVVDTQKNGRPGVVRLKAARR